jgi:hypothetical protein
MTAFWEKMKEFKQAEIDLETRKMRRAPSAADKLTLIVENSNTYTTVHAGNTKSGALVTFAVADWPNVVTMSTADAKAERERMRRLKWTYRRLDAPARRKRCRPRSPMSRPQTDDAEVVAAVLEKIARGVPLRKALAWHDRPTRDRLRRKVKRICVETSSQPPRFAKG